MTILQIGSAQDAVQLQHLADLGIAAEAEGKHEEAISYLKEVVKAQPGNFGAQGWLGKALLENGDVDGAIEPLKRAESGQIAVGQNHSYMSCLFGLGTETERDVGCVMFVVLGGVDEHALAGSDDRVSAKPR